MRTRAKYGWMLIGLLVVLVASPAYGQALWRNFFTTNQNPVVDVVAGSNATVQATTIGVNTRRFTVNSVPPTQLPYTVITNAPWVTTYPLLWSWQSISNLQSAQMPSTVITNPPWLPSNAQLTNQIYASNVVSGGQLPAGTVAAVAAPADGWILGNSNALRNWTRNGGMLTNLPASELVGSVPITLSGTLPWANLPQLTNSDYAPVALANLGTPAANHYPVMYCSDVVTSRGTGGYVRWDGANWRSWENVVATSSVLQWCLNWGKNPFTVSTTNCEAYFSDATSQYLLAYTSSGTAASAIGGGIDLSTGDIAARVSPGTSVGGYAGAGIGYWRPIAGGYFYHIGRVNILNLSDGTDTFRLTFGSTQEIGAYPTIGAYFLYDPQNTSGDNSSSNTTWLAVTRAASSSTVVNTGTNVAANTFYELEIFHTTTNVVFYINGLPICTNTTTLPAAGSYLWGPAMVMYRAAGSTTRYTYADYLGRVTILPAWTRKFP